MRVLYILIGIMLCLGNVSGLLTRDEVQFDRASLEAGGRLFDKKIAQLIEEAYIENHLDTVARSQNHLNLTNKWRIAFLSKTKKPISIERARILLVKWTERLSHIINKDPEIRPYLKRFPFDEKCTGITIIFVNKGGYQFSRDSLYYVSFYEGRVRYIQDGGKKKPIKEIYKETYKEALEIVRKEAPQVLPIRDWEVSATDSENKVEEEPFEEDTDFHPDPFSAGACVFQHFMMR